MGGTQDEGEKEEATLNNPIEAIKEATSDADLGRRVSSQT